MRAALLRHALAAFTILPSSAMSAPPPPTVAAILPAEPARDLTVRVCSACHAPEIVARQRLSPADWKEMVDTMASRGAQASDEELRQITDYLAKSFPDKPIKK